MLATPLTPVRAIADGQVVVRRTDSQGYEQVLVIEHTRPDGSHCVSIYGHLSDRTGYEMTTNTTVYRGDIIGYVGYDDENGDGGPHLHLGIHDGAYQGAGDYAGRAASTAGFLRPSDVIGSWNFNTTSVGWDQGHVG